MTKRLACLTMLLVFGAAACGQDEEQGPLVINPGFEHQEPVIDTGHHEADVEEDVALPPPARKAGDACHQDQQCISGECFPLPGFPQGYCSGPCGASCQEAQGACFSDADEEFCAKTCTTSGQCRTGYECLSFGPRGSFCLPPRFAPPSTEGAVDGEACVQDSDCRGGTCINDPNWPDGFCTTVGCETFEDCASDGEDNRCYRVRRGDNYCMRMCERQSDCRTDYICQPIGYGSAMCVPDPRAELNLDDIDEYPFEIECMTPTSTAVRLDFEIESDTVAYMVTPFASDGGRIYPSEIVTPSNQRINFRGANRFQAIPSQLFGFLNPTVVPAIGTMSGQLESGTHSYLLQTEASEVCHYVLQSKSLGTRLDLNVYLVGVPGLTAESAADDANMQAVLAKFDEIYAPAGVQLGEVRFKDITGADASQYQIIRSDADVANLVSLSTRPEGGMDQVLSANVFFVRGFAFSGGGGAIGISQGLPGAAALHGTPSSGVVFTSTYMGQQFTERNGDIVDGNAFTGVVFAHEIGHYLGLFHTSEQFGQGFDPLDDTPECRSGFPNNCPDLGNLMFPLADVTHTTVTTDQNWVINVNPLTKD